MGVEKKETEITSRVTRCGVAPEVTKEICPRNGCHTLQEERQRAANLEAVHSS